MANLLLPARHASLLAETSPWSSSAWSWLGLCVLLALAACRGQPTATPRSVADAVVSALDKGDARRFTAVLPPTDLLSDAFDCGRADTLRAALQRRLDDVPAEFEARRQANFRMRLVAFDEAGSETASLAIGDVFHGCTARRAVTLHRSKLRLSRTRGGRNEEVAEVWTFLRFEPDGPWYYAKF